ncbi:unnamed protein product [Brassicogethes aeneus]|uniref:pseudouridine 5'-phosphatase n=1 Tax=Brassicogethes aeneus TaxID=1431903 RepID=A0A9P0B4U4_BRAAE|nr:unnamed protein product [Brassicogethes aeneus]
MSRLNQMKFRKVTHVIFDMDGVLLDTEDLYSKAFQNILSQYGKNFDWPLKLEIMGRIGRDIAKYIIDKLNLPITEDEWLEMSQKELEKIMPQCEVTPGAKKLVTHLHENNIPIAVATSSGADSFKIKSERHKEFFKIFSHIICGGTDPNVKNGKPAPDIFLHCASLFPNAPNPNSCLVFEDSPNGVTAAVKAGMHCVMIPDENVPEDLRKDADVIVKSLDETDLSLFGLPPFK